MINPYRNSNSTSYSNKGIVQTQIFNDISSQRSSRSSKQQKQIMLPSKIYPYILSVLFIRKLRKNIKKRKHRQKILQQWLNTQKSYRLDLYSQLYFIKKPLDQKGIINNQQAIILFPEIINMLKLSQMMITVLQNNTKVSSLCSKIGKQMNKFTGEYKVYGKYFSTHVKRSQILTKITEMHELQLKQIQVNMQMQYTKKQSKKQNLTIKDCMDQPLYRLFKYVLLMKQYIKKLPPHHPDYSETSRCLNQFLQINNSNNELMRKIQENQKKLKIAQLFGSYLKQDREYVTEVQAKTINHDVKIYIFSDILLLTRIQTVLGTQKQYKLGVFQINQFGYVTHQQNLKYYKNIVMLISKQRCIHFFFDYEDTKLQFIKCINNLIRNIRIKLHSQRYLQNSLNLIKKSSTLSISSNDQPNIVRTSFPYFRVQIVGFQVRPSGAITNDTVYETRFMIPYYYEDEVNIQTQINNNNKKMLSKSQKSNNSSSFQSRQSVQINQSSQTLYFKKYCLNQKIQIHFNQLQQIYFQMQTFSSKKLPQIDLVTKDVNIYATGVRKTKPFEIRKFLMEELFNCAFRNTQIMNNSSWVVSKLRINQDLWNYAAKRNSALVASSKNQPRSYGYNHCLLCQNARIQSIQQFQNFRDFYSCQNHRQNKQAQKYCTNFFNLLRMTMLRLNHSSFNTIQRILLYYHYKEGRIDYPFFMHRSNEKHLKMIKVYLACVEQKYIQISIDLKTTVGEILQQIGAILELKNTFDFDLLANYGAQNRLLDRDQYVNDLLKSLDIKFEQYVVKNNEVKKKSKISLIQAFKTIGNHLFSSPTEQKKIYFLKNTYLSKTLQCKSYNQNPRKRHLQVEKVYWKIKKGLIKLSPTELIEMVAIYYCIKQYKNINEFQTFKISNRILEKVMPDQYIHMLHYQQQFKLAIGAAIESEKSIITILKNDLQSLYEKVLNLSYQKSTYRTYFIEVQPKQIPSVLLSGSQLLKSYLLGVNYKNLVIARNQPNPSVMTTLPIEDLQYNLSVHSIFINYENWAFRFDSKMLYSFGQMIRKYKSLSKKFPQLLA